MCLSAYVDEERDFRGTWYPYIYEFLSDARRSSTLVSFADVLVAVAARQQKSEKCETALRSEPA